jgi:hypothetical protein
MWRGGIVHPPSYPSLFTSTLATTEPQSDVIGRSSVKREVREEHANRCPVQEGTWNTSDNLDTQARRWNRCSP